MSFTDPENRLGSPSEAPSPEGPLAPGGNVDKALLELLASAEERILERLNHRILLLAFLRNGQNQVRTAKALGVSRNVLRTHLKRHGMIA